MTNSALHQVYLLTGSNSGNRAHYLAKAVEEVKKRVGEVRSMSALYETAAWGKTDEPAYLNQALLVLTSKSAREVLHEVLAVEQDMGRVREQKWASRIIDIDILFYDDAVIAQEGLKVPHPFVQDRRFALVPLREIAPGLVHPVLKRSVTALLENCTDVLEVKKWGDAV
jgi:2-amino-4-hydroxy-6-hydroxymethyldihydropteridine diphosphokinase